MSSRGSMQAVRRSSLAVVSRNHSNALKWGSRTVNGLLVRAYRSLVELQIDDAMARVAKFQAGILHADASIAARAWELAEALRAVLLLLQSHDDATVRAALAVIENRHSSEGRS